MMPQVMLLLLLLVFGLAGPAHGENRIDLSDTKSARSGSATVDERTGRIDLFDTKSRRTGYGEYNRYGDKKLDFYDSKGRRTGTGTIQGRGRR